MPRRLIDAILSTEPATRNVSLDQLCRDLSFTELLESCEELDHFWRSSENLYQRVRALFFLYAIHRFHLPRRPEMPPTGSIPYEGVGQLWAREANSAIDCFLRVQKQDGPNDALSSSLAAAYRQLGFQTLADQVRHSVRSVEANHWMFQIRRAAAQPLEVSKKLQAPDLQGGMPILRESTPVRLDLTHSAWSDIFFLGMDYPEGAKVLNISIDLTVRGKHTSPQPPIQTYLRVIDQPVLRLVSVDLETEAEITELKEVFDFARDYLGLLKAAVISSGLVPPSLENTDERLEELLRSLVGPGRGLEIVSHVQGIPRGSRLAVSTNLLASLIALCMRATGQTESLTGPLREEERRLIAARSILGEWLAGSGGGWQDSGGLWPAIKVIEGAMAEPGDPEYGVSKGRLLPNHRILGTDDVSSKTREDLQKSLVLVHGGMAQDVGPVLEMVTERYLLRSESSWIARKDAQGVFSRVLHALANNDIRELGAATDDNFRGPITKIIPWATNAFTEQLVERVRARFGDHCWGFWMLGGMSGGGMGFLFDPQTQPSAVVELGEIMNELKHELEFGLPFAMDPVVYDFAINEHGSAGDFIEGDAPLPPDYYSMRIPRLVRKESSALSAEEEVELRRFGIACGTRPELQRMPEVLFNEFFPAPTDGDSIETTLKQLLKENGFAPELHEEIRTDMRSGRIGLARNRLPADTSIDDVTPEHVLTSENIDAECLALGRAALESGDTAVVTLAAGLGTRWTQGAGVVKALNPFFDLAGRHRTFLEVHLAKSRRAAQQFGMPPPHVFTTSYLTHAPIEAHVASHHHYGYQGSLHLSQGRSVGLRMIPMERDLRFLWEETAQQLLDEQAQKVRESLQASLIAWARSRGEADDYRDNIPAQCLHPAGHWYEVPNLILNGTLARLLKERPGLKTILLHNIDTLGADLEPGLLGLHLKRGGTLSFEVVPRRIEDRGGGLARVNDRTRLVESLALPREEDEYRLSYYNSMTTWIDIDGLLKAFQLEREDLTNGDRVAEAVRKLSRRIPTYVTLKEVKKRWGHGQEDIYPVAQYEKLWSDMSSLKDLDCQFIVVPRERGQQLKDVEQLDSWVQDGSADHVHSICDFG